MAMYLRYGEFLANIGFAAGVRARKQTQTQLCLLSLRIRIPYNKAVCSNPALIRNLEEKR
jgi:hypothetical protein